MNKKELINFFINSNYYSSVLENLKKYNKLSLKNVSGSALSILSSIIFKKLNVNFLFIFSEQEEAMYFLNDVQEILPKENLHFYPPSFKSLSQFQKKDNYNLILRTELMKKISKQNNEKLFIICTEDSLLELVPSKKEINKHKLHIEKNQFLNIDNFIDKLMNLSFEQSEFVYEPGQFSVRGGIIDVFSYASDYPFRIELFGDKVESLRLFNPETQLSVQKTDSVDIVPVIDKSNKFYPLWDIIDAKKIWIEDENKLKISLIEKINYIKKNNNKDKYNAIDENNIENFLQKNHFIAFNSNDNKYKNLDLNIKPQPDFNRNFNLLHDNLKELHNKGYKIFISSPSNTQLKRLQDIFNDISEEHYFKTVKLNIHKGFVDNILKVALYTDHQIFGRYHKYNLRTNKFKKPLSITIKELNELKPGDYVVHIDHGIGKFSGLHKIKVNGKFQEAIKIIYKGGDILYLGINSLHKISKYSSEEGKIPTLHKLGSAQWKRTKEKTKKSIKKLAFDLITLYAKRKASKGFAFSPDTYLQNELEASFLYEDTPDQLKAMKDVKKDMEANYPMDRLVCGDVGFGKTEIAIRAAFKAVADNKQVAVLVPTTILCLQHFKTFKQRLENFPCNIDYLNRTRTTKEQKEIIRKIKSGEIDIIIATHRLLSKDIEFNDLGLLIIDEEQRFGVAAKEKLRNLKVNVDTLTLTATPIPRTLQFSLMGAKDLSIINTPPPNRRPIHTEVIIFDKNIIKNAIDYEISRNGQVFFLHNRIQNINEIANMIKNLCPYASLCIAHGQMKGKDLEKTMCDFIEGKYDILLATSIIESGLDIPNVNTIIINNAHRFGLSELHQLRGRVGRSNKKAFCYLTIPSFSILSQEAKKRLKAITEFSDLGSGFLIAMRDLDIRGAGDILGAEQSGFISDIGYETYQKILDEALNELKEKEFKNLNSSFKKIECTVDTDLEILIPDNYVSNVTERFNLYNELLKIKTEEQLLKFESMLADRFGKVPQQVLNLFDTIRLKWIGEKIGLQKIVYKVKTLLLYFPEMTQENNLLNNSIFKNIINYINDNPDNIKLKQKKNTLFIRIDNVENIKSAINLMNEMICEEIID